MKSGPTPPGRGTFPYYVRRLQDRTPFAFSRWGDGEWSAILGMSGENCDGHRYSRRLREDLTEVLLAQPSYDLALQGLAMRRFGDQIQAWLARRRLSIDWVDADIFARRSIANELQPLFQALAARQVVLVGPAHLQRIARRFPLAGHIIVPDSNCHDDVVRVVDDTTAHLRGLEDVVVAVSAGMSANVIIHRLSQGEARHHTLIDFGSLWEPYVGLAIRRYHHRVLQREETQL